MQLYLCPVHVVYRGILYWVRVDMQILATNQPIECSLELMYWASAPSVLSFFYFLCFHCHSFRSFSQRVLMDEAATDPQWPPVAPDSEPPGTSYSPSFNLRLTCGASHSTFMFNLYKYPPPPNAPPQAPPPAVQRSIPISTQRRSSSGYAEVTFTPTDNRGINRSRASLVATPTDNSRVNYAEISVEEV